VRRVWRQRQREAIAAPRCQVARPIKSMGLAGVVRGKTVNTTHGDKSTPCSLDRVYRQFRAPAPNVLWVGLRLHLCRNLARLRLRRLCHRHCCPAHRWLEHLALSARGLRTRRARAGAVPRRWSSPPSNGSTGSTIIAYSNRSATSHPPRQGRATMPKPTSVPWRRDANQTASGRPGAIQRAATPPPCRLRQRLQLRQATQDIQRPHAIRMHLPALADRTATVSRTSAPSKPGIKHLRPAIASLLTVW
jgi:hypothetical protein